MTNRKPQKFGRALEVGRSSRNANSKNKRRQGEEIAGGAGKCTPAPRAPCPAHLSRRDTANTREAFISSREAKRFFAWRCPCQAGSKRVSTCQFRRYRPRGANQGEKGCGLGGLCLKRGPPEVGSRGSTGRLSDQGKLSHWRWARDWTNRDPASLHQAVCPPKSRRCPGPKTLADPQLRTISAAKHHADTRQTRPPPSSRAKPAQAQSGQAQTRPYLLGISRTDTHRVTGPHRPRSPEKHLAERTSGCRAESSEQAGLQRRRLSSQGGDQTDDHPPPYPPDQHGSFRDRSTGFRIPA